MTMMKIGRLIKMLSLSACILTVTGCAVGNKHQYAGVTPSLTLESAYSTAVAVQDRRPYIIDHDKDEDFVGLQRGGFGNPFDVTTKSGNPLATDIRNAIITALKKRDIYATPVDIKPTAPEVDAKKALVSAGADRALFLRMDEWKADTYTNTALHYDMHLSVLDRQGSLLAESAQEGEDDLGGSAWNPPAHAESAVPVAFKHILENLLNDPKVMAALR
jgi:hypothetical protein